MPDYAELPRQASVITVFDSTQKVSGSSPYTALINIAGSKNIVVMQYATQINAGTRTLGSVSSNFANNSSAINNDVNDSASAQYGSGGVQTSMMSIDFQTSAARKLWAKFQPTQGTNNSWSVTVTVDYSNDDSTWVTPENLFTGVPGTTQTREMLCAQQTFRYARFTFTIAITGSGLNGALMEVWEDQTGLGKSDIEIEIQDPVNNQWHTMVPTSAFKQISSQITSDKDMKDLGVNIRRPDTPTQTGYAIFTSTTWIRVKMTVIGKVNTSAVIIRT